MSLENPDYNRHPQKSLAESLIEAEAGLVTPSCDFVPVLDKMFSLAAHAWKLGISNVRRYLFPVNPLDIKIGKKYLITEKEVITYDSPSHIPPKNHGRLRFVKYPDISPESIDSN